MWIQSTAGAFSLVLADTSPESGIPDPDTVMIRARLRTHLELLQAEHTALAGLSILRSDPSHDYRWRLIVPKKVAAKVVADLVLGIDYRNFKDACSGRQELCSDYLTAVSQVWGSLRRMQDNAT